MTYMLDMCTTQDIGGKFSKSSFLLAISDVYSYKNLNIVTKEKPWKMKRKTKLKIISQEQ